MNGNKWLISLLEQKYNEAQREIKLIKLMFAVTESPVPSILIHNRIKLLFRISSRITELRYQEILNE